MRAPFQVLVLPYRRAGEGWEYGVFRRADAGYWQAIAGGGEDDETPIVAARREAAEEAGIPTDALFSTLETTSSVPVHHFRDHAHWTSHRYVIPTHCFGVDAAGIEIQLSHEHTDFPWVSHDEAAGLLHWDSDVTALWELSARLTAGDLRRV